MSFLVVGAGSMGIQLSLLFSSIGEEVFLLVRPGTIPEKTKSLASTRKKLFSKELLIDNDNDVVVVDSLKSVPKNVSFVLEAIIEDKEEKRKLFLNLSDYFSEDCLFATNTSSLSVRKIFKGLPNQSRCFGMHFFNPVFRMPLVEVIPVSGDNPEKFCEVICAKLGKEFVVCPDSPGFVVNRLLFSLIASAMDLRNSNGMSVEEIDRTVRLGLRHPMGPFQLCDLIGLKVVLKIFDSLHARTNDPLFDRKSELKPMIDAGKSFYP